MAMAVISGLMLILSQVVVGGVINHLIKHEGNSAT